jgi:Lon protease-like protein
VQNKRIIPLFPLNILPLPGEVVPLHIFEQKYRDLLEDLEQEDLCFGILYVSSDNPQQFGAIMKLEQILKRYPTGESDIVVKCEGSFMLLRYLESYDGRRYAGAEVVEWPQMNVPVESPLKETYVSYLEQLNQAPDALTTLDDVACELGLDMADKIKYIKLRDPEKKQRFLHSRVQFKTFIVEQEKKYRHSFQLN